MGLRKKATVHEVDDHEDGHTTSRQYTATAAGIAKRREELTAKLTKLVKGT